MDEWDDFVDDVCVVGVVSVGAVGRGDRFVHPRFVVDRPDGKEHDFAGFDIIGDASDHAEIFVFVVATARGREDDDGFPGVTVDVERHVFAQRRAEPVEEFFFHGNFCCLRRAWPSMKVNEYAVRSGNSLGCAKNGLHVPHVDEVSRIGN